MTRALQFGTGTVTGQNRNGLRNAMIFVFGINTGLRISDIVKAKVSDIEDGNGTTLLKQDPQEPACLYWQYQQDLENYIDQMQLKPSDWLFPSRKGEGHIEGKSFYKDLKRAARQCEIDPSTVGTHTLRKTFGYHYIKSATTSAGDPDPRALYKRRRC
ncbi:tyrosine-type recombinase/integrase [Lactobacillus delbrueckii]|uniref:tyrosine-type recombinase/integrase n=1 Tax=Lactobacillus delbrueckii TaxID=1584 RepID=UPI0012E1F1DC|nr:tyrosine-type recombinase/integrase [Lactobacillus delbrueckii]QGT62095.1 tyrosine-type recombinase/integrase [Lactobacillus delbrueckii]